MELSIHLSIPVCGGRKWSVHDRAAWSTLCVSIDSNQFFFICPVLLSCMHPSVQPWANIYHFIRLFLLFKLFEWNNRWVFLSRRRYPKDTKPKFNSVKSKKPCSFHEFASSTDDAWDIDDDEEDEDFRRTPLPASLAASGQDPMQNQVSTRRHLQVRAALSQEVVSPACGLFSARGVRRRTREVKRHAPWDHPNRRLRTSRKSTRSVSGSTAKLWSLAARQTWRRPQVS